MLIAVRGNGMWVLMGCGGEPPVPSDAPTAEEVVLATPERPFHDGTRLRGITAVDEHGNRFHVGVYDAERGRLCEFQRTSTTTWGCFPLADYFPSPLSLYSAEPTCADPSFLLLAGAVQMRDRDPATCAWMWATCWPHPLVARRRRCTCWPSVRSA